MSLGIIVGEKPTGRYKLEPTWYGGVRTLVEIIGYVSVDLALHPTGCEPVTMWRSAQSADLTHINERVH